MREGLLERARIEEWGGGLTFRPPKEGELFERGLIEDLRDI
jgi:hypothetical protein